MNNASYILNPIDPTVADGLRRLGGPVVVANCFPGYPCRQCLRDAQIGEDLMLVSHDPFATDSKYRSASPIFLHVELCGAPAELSILPPQLTQRQLSVRSFDAHETMLDAAVIDGTELETTIHRFFSADESQQIHVHNATRGCWAVSVDRAS